MPNRHERPPRWATALPPARVRPRQIDITSGKEGTAHAVPGCDDRRALTASCSDDNHAVVSVASTKYHGIVRLFSISIYLFISGGSHLTYRSLSRCRLAGVVELRVLLRCRVLRCDAVVSSVWCLHRRHTPRTRWRDEEDSRVRVAYLDDGVLERRQPQPSSRGSVASSHDDDRCSHRRRHAPRTCPC